MRKICLAIALGTSACTTIGAGHMGLLLTSHGLQHDALQPGWHYISPGQRLDDFDITYSTHDEQIETVSVEGLGLSMKMAVIYRPVSSQLYQLDDEIGLNYYDEIIGPEFRSAARGVFARHSYLELLRHNEDIENEIEADLRRRTNGKHVEISSVTMEAVEYAPEIGKAIQDKLVAEQDAARQKTLLENEAARRRLELQSQADQEKIRAEAAVREKDQEIQLAKEQVTLDRLREEAANEKRLMEAKAEAEETRLRSEAAAAQARLVAEAHAAENKALTPLAVMLHGYDALATLANKDAHVYLGDWSHVPSLLFPAGLVGLSGAGRVPAKSE